MSSSNFEAARQFAEFGLAEKRKGNRESASGPGSTRKAARPALEVLRRLIRRRPIRSMLDLGCGDWNWMQYLELPDGGRKRGVRYEGWDASPDLIDGLTREFGQKNISFQLQDVTTAELPQVDLIVARDILFHLPRQNTIDLLQKIRRSTRYFASTSFLGMGENSEIQSYLPIEGWGFYKINLNRAPFNLGEDMIEAQREPEGWHSGHNRFFCLYEFSDSGRKTA